MLCGGQHANVVISEKVYQKLSFVVAKNMED